MNCGWRIYQNGKLVDTIDVKIDYEKIPLIDVRSLARVFTEDIKRTFQDPEVQKEFAA